MTLKLTLRLALTALIRNKARSMLTMLGIVIGVAAVIVTVAIGVGARTSVQQSIDSLGSNLIVVQPGSVTQTGARTGFGGASTLTPDDGLAIAKLPGVAAVSPTVSLRTQVVAGENNWQTTITGVAPTYTFIRSWPLASGRFFNENEVASAAKVGGAWADRRRRSSFRTAIRRSAKRSSSKARRSPSSARWLRWDRAASVRTRTTSCSFRIPRRWSGLPG